MRKRYYLIIISLLVSLFIYLFYRTEKTVINEIAIHVIPVHDFLNLRESVTTFLTLNEVVIYSLPEGLWVFCITLTSMPYYIRVYNSQLECAIIPLAFSIGLEVLQLLRVTNGRFDFTDIALSLIFWILAKHGFDDRSEKQNIFAVLDRRTMVCFATYGIVYLSHVLE